MESNPDPQAESSPGGGRSWTWGCLASSKGPPSGRSKRGRSTVRRYSSIISDPPGGRGYQTDRCRSNRPFHWSVEQTFGQGRETSHFPMIGNGLVRIRTYRVQHGLSTRSETGVGLRLEVRQALQGQGVKSSSTSPQPPSIDAERIPQNRRPRRTESRLVSLRQQKYLDSVECVVSSILLDRRRRA